MVSFTKETIRRHTGRVEKNREELKMKYWNVLLHGGDYNPGQWLDHPEILKEDIRLMKLYNMLTIL